MYVLYRHTKYFISSLKIETYYTFSSVHSVVSDSLTPWTAAHQDSLSITNSWSLLKLMSTELVIPSNYLILCPPSPPAFNLSQHQGLFQGVSSLRQVAKVLEFQLQHSPSMNIQDWFPLGLAGLISLLFKGLSRVFSNITVQKHQFFSVQPSLWSNSHICGWLLGKT